MLHTNLLWKIYFHLYLLKLDWPLDSVSKEDVNHWNGGKLNVKKLSAGAKVNTGTDVVVVASVVVVVKVVVAKVVGKVTLFLVRIFLLGLGLLDLVTEGFLTKKFFIPFCNFLKPLFHHGFHVVGPESFFDSRGFGQVEQCSSYWFEGNFQTLKKYFEVVYYEKCCLVLINQSVSR